MIFYHIPKQPLDIENHRLRPTAIEHQDSKIFDIAQIIIQGNNEINELINSRKKSKRIVKMKISNGKIKAKARKLETSTMDLTWLRHF